MSNKLKSLFASRRFWGAIAGIVFVVVDSLFPGSIDQDTVNNTVILIGGWIVADSLRKTSFDL